MNRKWYTATFLLILITGLADASVGKKEDRNALVPGTTAKRDLKRNAVKLAPNPSTDGTVTVSSLMEEKLNFYIFDLDGTLVQRAILSNKQNITFRNLAKGVYLYDAFLNDQGVERGQIVVK